MPFLSGADRLFERTIDRTFGTRTDSLKDTVKKVDQFIENPSTDNMLSLLRSIEIWKQSNPVEYQNRLGSHRSQFEDEVAQRASMLLKGHAAAFAVSLNEAWAYVTGYLNELREFSTYAVQDMHAYAYLIHPLHAAEVRMRYRYWSENGPATKMIVPPTRLAKDAGDEGWREHLWRAYQATRYVVPQSFHYSEDDHSGWKGAPALIPLPASQRAPANTITLTSLGSAVCTSFAKAGTHILTHEHRNNAPRVELVAWSAGAMAAHVYILVGRRPIYDQNDPNALPLDWDPEGAVVVDPWAAGLGYPVMWRANSFPPQLSGMRTPLRLIVKSEDLPG